MGPLDLSPGRATALAGVLEEQQRGFAAIRYGSRFRVGLAQVVLNPDAPLTAANFAAGLAGSPAAAEASLELLPDVFAEAGRNAAVLLDSPSSLPELGALAEEVGYAAAEESAVMLLTRPESLVEEEPGRMAVPVPEVLEDEVAGVLADAFDYPPRVAAALHRVVGQRLDDPRVAALGAMRDGVLSAVATAFVDDGVGFVTDLGVRGGARGHGLGRAVASAAAATCLSRGAHVVWLACEAGGTVERFWSRLGFEAAYSTITYLANV